MKPAQLLIALSISFLMGAKAWGATYTELRKVGVNYLIASLAIESIKKTECSYVLKTSKLTSHREVLNKVQKKLNPADNYELPNQVTNIQKQMDIDIKTQLLEFKLKIDEKTACGMLTSHAINKFLESEAEWYKKLSN